MPLEIVRNDITKMKVDVIVNAANPQLQMGGGVCGAIFREAGEEELQEACYKIGGCKVGEAVITPGFKLDAKWIIHTPGPIWQGGLYQEADLLKASYENSLNLAKGYQCQTIAFPLISTGIYGYPKEEALQIAVSTISSFLFQYDMQVYLVVFDKNTFGLSKKLFSSIQEYINEYYVEEFESTFQRNRLEELTYYDWDQKMNDQDVKIEEGQSLVSLLNQLDEPFSKRLLRIIDEKGMTDVEVYKKANMDRRLFSKIRTGNDYSPKKKTVLALAVALQLNLEETIELLETAGYALSHSHKFDVIVEFFIQQDSYNIHEINEALFAFDQPLLGS
ncbi:macro domain-containing protein [Niallia sp. XMNu-256]|uniref:macro domain-containing protein n=1 Tax=Niallia sp. XMNu-256 TaxID=3082444 RepID=UPI0030D4B8BD